MAGKEEMEFKKKIEKLSNIICETAPGIQHCPIVDYVADLANMVLFSELNKKLLADRIDKLEQLSFNAIVLFCEKLEKQSFAGWTEEEIRGYKTALTTIKEKAKG